MRLWAMRGWALAALMLVFVPTLAHAAPGTCTMTATDISFGVYAGGQTTATGSIKITCMGGNGNNTVTVDLSYGSTSMNFPNSTANRQMSSGASRLAYQIYTSPARSTIWGDGSGGTQKLTGVPINYQAGANPPPVTTTVTPFAVVFAGALPPHGVYSDLIVVRLEGANPSSATFNVTADVLPVCSVSASDLNFGAYSRVQLDGTTTVSATCTFAAPYSVGLDQGVAAGSTVTTRKMKGPAGALLNYSLFQNSGRTTNWGNTVGTDTVGSIGTGVAQTFTVFGRIPAAQAVGPGAYQDTITVTVTF
jgi:spore coat protein U-like protein